MSVAYREVQVLEECYLCACGCGEEINPKVRHIDELLARGMNKRQIALRLQVSPHYIRILTREATPDRQGRPKFVKGHSSRTHVWVDASCRNCGKAYRKCGVQQFWCRSHECQEARWLAVGSFELLARIATEQEGTRRTPEMVRDEIAMTLWRQQKISEQQQIIARRDQMRERQQRASDRADRLAEESLFYRHASLDAPKSASNTVLLGEGIAGMDDDPVAVLLNKELAWRIMELTGCTSAAEIAELDEETRLWFVHRLQEEGLTARGITTAAREEVRPKRRVQHPRTHSRLDPFAHMTLDDIKPGARGHSRMVKEVKKREKWAKKRARRERAFDTRAERDSAERTK